MRIPFIGVGAFLFRWSGSSKSTGRPLWGRAAPSSSGGADLISVRRVFRVGPHPCANGLRGIDGCVWLRIKRMQLVDFGREVARSRNPRSSHVLPLNPQGFDQWEVRPEPAFCDAQLGAFILRYEDVRRIASPEQAILDFFESTYEGGATLAQWDRAALERKSPISSHRGGQ